MRGFILFVFTACIAQSLHSQNYLGTWTSHLPYNNASGLTIAENRIYCSTEGGIFYFDKSDNSINKFSKENGLTESEVSAIKYSDEDSVLLIAYKNANIDLVKDGTIYNLPDIKRKQILGDKNIYNIYFRENLAYLSCGFGIVVVNTERREIKDSYLIGDQGSQVKVNEVNIFNDKIYAATDEGLFHADLNSPNLANFNNWSREPRFGSPDLKISSIVSGSEFVYVSIDDESGKDSLYYSDGSAWVPHVLQTDLINSMNILEDRLIVSSFYHVQIFNENNEPARIVFSGNPSFASIDEEGLLWVSDRLTGLLRFSPNGENDVLVPNGPESINTASLMFKNGKLLGVAGGTTSSWNNLFRQGQVYSFANNRWSGIKIDSLRDFIRIEIDPIDTGHFFIGSWGYGLVEFRNNEFVNHYTDLNSTLQSIIPGGYFFRLGGLAFDDNRNLWVTNGGVPNPLSVLTPDGDWYSFPVGSALNALNMSEILVTEFNHKWIILQGGNGLFVFDDKGTFENTDDDDFTRLSVVDRNNGIITNEIYSFAEDRKGNIWLGTNKGIVVYYSPSRVFSDEGIYAQQIIVPRNDGSGLGDPLLGTESVSCIAVDGANRKWIGTRNGGVFLVSEDGLEEIHAFNTENSPLLSNSITDITINDETGEVFFATSNGIISYVSDATEPGDIFEDVYVFPNPVREDYSGDIIVSGLIENTIVKITDLNGNIVFETKSLGGQAIWDGKNFHGDRVATGVYLVFCSDEDGTQTHVTKLLFIN